MYRGLPRGVIYSEVPTHAPSLRAHAISSMTAPARLDRSKVKFQPGMYLNDTLGTCAEAGLAHTIRGQASLLGWDVGVTNQQIETLYSDAAGYVPGQDSTDKGTDLVKLMTYQAQAGFSVTNDLYSGLWAALDPQNLNLLRVVMNEMAVGMIAVNLAEADQVGGGIWQIKTPASYGDPKAGSWGAHCIGIWDYTGLTDNDTVRLITWGGFQRATWAWVLDRIYQAFALSFLKTLGPTGLNAAGLDRDRLAADVQAFGASA